MAILTVSNLNDSGSGSLREAVLAANLTVGVDSVVFAANLSGELTLTSGALTLTNDVTIDGDTNGDDKADITISTSGYSRIFTQTGATTDVALYSLTLTGGNAGAGGGGAIFASDSSKLYLINSTITGNTAYFGGGIFAQYTSVIMYSSLVSNNTATGNSSGGGGILILDGGLSLTNTTIDGNSSNATGGGIRVQDASLFIQSSTITNNHANADGGLTNGGGGINIYISAYASTSDTATITNSVIADNTSGGATENDVSGTVKTASHSVFGVAPTVITISTANQLNVADVGLGTLALHGGTTATRNIESPTSVLLNTGIFTVDTPATDANGDTRRQGSAVDIGATEFSPPPTTITVTNLNNSGAGSLRAALDLANAYSGHDHIVFQSGMSGIITLTTGALTLREDVTIDGDTNEDNKADIIISGDNAFRIFTQTGFDTDINLLSLTLTEGLATGTSFYSNYGGAIFAKNSGTLNIFDTTITGNSATNGGGLYASGTTVTISNSLISANFATSTVASFKGGGIYFRNDTFTLTNSTVVGNISTAAGGGIASRLATVNIINSTITNNGADIFGFPSMAGGGIAVASSVLTIANSVIADNTSGNGGSALHSDVYGTVTTATNSVFGTAVIITTSIANQLNVANVGLGEMLDNGGTVLTRSPLDGSVLIGAGNNGTLPPDTFDLDQDGNTTELLPRDGRGGLRIVGGTVDVGAVEQIVDETIRGTTAANIIIGGLGTDNLSGLAGVDMLSGGDGLDTLSGGTGSDTVLGGAGQDVLLVGNGLAGDFDILDGGTERDLLDMSGLTNGAIWIDYGYNVISGPNMASGFNLSMAVGEARVLNMDSMVGTSFNDTMRGDAGSNLIDGGAGDDILLSYSPYDTLTPYSSLGDVMLGGLGNDLLFSGTGNDYLDGGADNDILEVGGGTDTVVTGTGNDTIFFSPRNGTDTVTDFTGGAGVVDVLKLYGFGTALDTYAEVFAVSSQQGADTHIALTDTTIILQNFTRATLVADDFVFV
jgi:hypothetical protein